MCGVVAVALAIALLFSTTETDKLQAGRNDPKASQQPEANEPVSLVLQPLVERDEPLPQQSEPELVETVTLKPAPIPDTDFSVSPFNDLPADSKPIAEIPVEVESPPFNPFGSAQLEPIPQPKILTTSNETETGPKFSDLQIEVLPLEPRFDSIPLDDGPELHVTSAPATDDSVVLAAIEEGWNAGLQRLNPVPLPRGVELQAVDLASQPATDAIAPLTGKSSTLFQQIDVTLKKQAPETASITDWSPFVLTVTNNSDQTIPRVEVTEVLPVATRVELDPEITVAEIRGNSIHWQVDDLEPNQSRTLRILAKPAEAGELLSQTQVNSIVLVSGETKVESAGEPTPVDPLPLPMPTPAAEPVAESPAAPKPSPFDFPELPGDFSAKPVALPVVETKPIEQPAEPNPFDAAPPKTEPAALSPAVVETKPDVAELSPFGPVPTQPAQPEPEPVAVDPPNNDDPFGVELPARPLPQPEPASVEADAQVGPARLVMALSVRPSERIRNRIRLHFEVRNIGQSTSESATLRLLLPGELRHEFGNDLEYDVAGIQPGEVHTAILDVETVADGLGSLAAHLVRDEKILWATISRVNFVKLPADARVAIRR